MNKIKAFAVLIVTIGLSIILFQNFISGTLPAVQRLSVKLDDGSEIYVDNASTMSQAQVQSLVLAADRSTQSGCPYSFPKKGLMKGGKDADAIKNGDRVFISDYYLAWFDYTLTDGVGTHSWSRSGTLAGYWTLNPVSKTFKYFYDSYSPEKELPNADGICWNWARNELIPGSNSPKGQLYWWDKFAPPLENTIVVKRPVAGPNGEAYADINLFSTVYTQGVNGSQFVRGSDGVQNAVGVHYSTAGLMTSWKGDTSFVAAHPKNLSQVSTGQIHYVVDFVCKQKEIQVVWIFNSTATLIPVNYYMDIWSAHSGLGPTTTCIGGETSAPPKVFGVGAALNSRYHSYNFARSSLPYGVASRTGAMTFKSANLISEFPWKEAVPCNGLVNVGVITNTITSGLPIGASLEVGFASDLNRSKPYFRLTNRLSPTQGDGSPSNPAAFPFQQMMTAYENSDQQHSLIMTSYDSGQVIEANKHYISSYSIGSH